MKDVRANKMVNSKIVIHQVQEYHVILHEIHSNRMEMSEAFKVVTIIEKLLPTWKDFENYLKHRRREMSLEDLIIKL